jgi:hypothetical protein
MSILLGYDFWADSVFLDDSTSLGNVKYSEYGNSIIDEISLRSKTNIAMDNVKDTTWNNDQNYLAKFINNLNAGNISNDGIKVIKFKIMRRMSNQGQNEDIYLGEIPFDSNVDEELEFVDSTQPNSKLIYTILPVGENNLDGSPKEVEIESSFTGVWIVNKNTGEVLVFDSAIGGSVGNVDSTLNQSRTQIDTFNKFPQFYYGETSYESFTLSTVILPEDGERTGVKYKEILDRFILDHTPKIVKTDTGRILVADISNIRASTPINTWDQYDFTTISVDVTECYDYEKFMKGE